MQRCTKLNYIIIKTFDKQEVIYSAIYCTWLNNLLKSIYKWNFIWYIKVVLITYQEQLGYYKKVENRKALTAPFWSRYLFT